MYNRLYAAIGSVIFFHHNLPLRNTVNKQNQMSLWFFIIINADPVILF